MSNFGDTAKTLISTYAPTVGLALGGPLGGLAGGILAKVFGTKAADGSVTPADPKAIEKLILGQDPAVALQLQQAENELTEHMRQFDVSEEQLRYQDVDSARKREMSVKDWTPALLTYLLTFGVGLMWWTLFKYDLPVRNEPVIFSIAGAITTAWAGATSYYFGTSAGSDTKNAIIATFAKK